MGLCGGTDQQVVSALGFFHQMGKFGKRPRDSQATDWCHSRLTGMWVWQEEWLQADTCDALFHHSALTETS